MSTLPTSCTAGTFNPTVPLWWEVQHEPALGLALLLASWTREPNTLQPKGHDSDSGNTSSQLLFPATSSVTLSQRHKGPSSLSPQVTLSALSADSRNLRLVWFHFWDACCAELGHSYTYLYTHQSCSLALSATQQPTCALLFLRANWGHHSQSKLARGPHR